MSQADELHETLPVARSQPGRVHPGDRAAQRIDGGRPGETYIAPRAHVHYVKIGRTDVPKFTKLDPNDVQIGRGRSAHEARHPYRNVLVRSEAGSIELERGDVPSTVKRHLSLAAQDVGTKVRSSW
jgi:hypothetical protein